VLVQVVEMRISLRTFNRVLVRGGRGTLSASHTTIIHKATLLQRLSMVNTATRLNLLSLFKNHSACSQRTYTAYLSFRIHLRYTKFHYRLNC
jgi:hypothetical protein